MKKKQNSFHLDEKQVFKKLLKSHVDGLKSRPKLKPDLSKNKEKKNRLLSNKKLFTKAQTEETFQSSLNSIEKIISRKLRCFFHG